ncbi:hypothetical protein BV22DRAFT_1120007 [Leucogyrophana mollusca]|uniref:Uncharacterized protein n=1 Tax=Leucogyrophana mollusca TaxID=85980 RepID=A0ACB8BGU0_9AGAM|nr:hypothetical protein BV22DRAFT_1120007 [Leucogyrophana mollusca]
MQPELTCQAPDALDTYARKSDCFQNAASLLRTRCGESHMGEDERVQAAIAMTLCELATARRHAPPMECGDFTGGRIPLPVGSAHQAQGECVEALSRSAQFWSSYSGYLREIRKFSLPSGNPNYVTLFEDGWTLVDVAKDIYRNITLEKVSLIRIILNREKISKTNIQGWEHSLRAFRDDLSTLHATTDKIQATSDAMATVLGDRIHSFFSDIEGTISGLQQQYQDSHLQSIAKVHGMMDDVYRHHSEFLSVLLPTFQQSISSELDTVFSLIADQNQRSFEAADYLRQQWILLESGFMSMHTSIRELQNSIDQASDALATSVNQAHAAHRIQQEATDSTARLVDVVTQLTALTYDEMQAINQTANMIKANIRQDTVGHWLKLAAISVLRSLWPGPSPIDNLLSSHSFRTGISLATVLWRLLELCFSLVTSACLVFNIKQFFPSLSPFSATHKKLALPVTMLPSHRSHELIYSQPPLDFALTPYHPPRDPRIIRQLSRPRISRIPNRLCNRPADYTLWN